MIRNLAAPTAAILLATLAAPSVASAQDDPAQPACAVAPAKKKGLGLGGLLGAAKRAGVGDMLGGRMGGGLFGGNKGGQVANAIAGTAMEAAVASTADSAQQQPVPCALAEGGAR